MLQRFGIYSDAQMRLALADANSQRGPGRFFTFCLRGHVPLGGSAVEWRTVEPRPRNVIRDVIRVVVSYVSLSNLETDVRETGHAYRLGGAHAPEKHASARVRYCHQTRKQSAHSGSPRRRGAGLLGRLSSPSYRGSRAGRGRLG